MPKLKKINLLLNFHFIICVLPVFFPIPAKKQTLNQDPNQTPNPYTL